MNAIIKKQNSNKMLTVNTILLITATTTALSAGVFYTFTCAINLGLGRLPDKEYLSAMQSINKEILNPLFFISFWGALVLLPISSYLNYSHPASHRFVFLSIATLIYAIGVFGVTFLEMFH